MSKASCVVSCPIDTYSGYGGRSRDFVKALIKSKPDWDVKILAQRWGNTRTGYLKDHNDKELLPLIINQIHQQPDVWIQITVPNEFQKVGKYNIGVTAGIETTVCAHTWVEGVNRMDLVLTSSNHSKDTFNRSVFAQNDQQGRPVGEIRVSTPIEVLFEGLDTETYFKKSGKSNSNISLAVDSIKESFCYLTMGHWMQGNLGHDRKNIGYTIKAFLETFKNKSNPPGLVLRVQQANSSVMDQKAVLKKIDKIRKTVKGKLPNIYLLHGDLSDEHINDLYNHPKIKAMVSLAKGEGFGRPLLEFGVTGKPIIASGWSGQLDFLNTETAFLVGGDLEPVDPSAAVKEVLLTEAHWFKPNDGEVGKILKQVHKKYKDALTTSRKQPQYIKNNFTFEKMKDRLSSILGQNVPEFAQQMELKMPSLKLPKLKKVEA